MSFSSVTTLLAGVRGFGRGTERFGVPGTVGMSLLREIYQERSRYSSSSGLRETWETFERQIAMVNALAIGSHQFPDGVHQPVDVKCYLLILHLS